VETVAFDRFAAAISGPGGVGRGHDLNHDVMSRPRIAARFADSDLERRASCVT
jgi:hypothetical protein